MWESAGARFRRSIARSPLSRTRGARCGEARRWEIDRHVLYSEQHEPG